jgi:hypothetical protein
MFIIDYCGAPIGGSGRGPMLFPTKKAAEEWIRADFFKWIQSMDGVPKGDPAAMWADWCKDHKIVEKA